ncbi:hypothetical protein K450DRAFT_219114 [Umbelopsis ramanniana AG]|uniref:Uncharacterized protein n=1 Tax=Umbelopsis ramanniana AG TaxID=1314678 RepID=A0AAD5EIY6_UMBRA|nr:uncharacterized protein K450DRAFT_219114 [Umbelopsis ramanniana AG]KAI8584287.1 hypothetical protein K450DRAFT_219114 [Umbelopsis ramanniana AG]
MIKMTTIILNYHCVVSLHSNSYQPCLTTVILPALFSVYHDYILSTIILTIYLAYFFRCDPTFFYKIIKATFFDDHSILFGVNSGKVTHTSSLGQRVHCQKAMG